MSQNEFSVPPSPSIKSCLCLTLDSSASGAAAATHISSLVIYLSHSYHDAGAGCRRRVVRALEARVATMPAQSADVESYVLWKPELPRCRNCIGGSRDTFLCALFFCLWESELPRCCHEQVPHVLNDCLLMPTQRRCLRRCSTGAGVGFGVSSPGLGLAGCIFGCLLRSMLLHPVILARRRERCTSRWNTGPGLTCNSF